MSDNSAIEWTDATWNPTAGCTIVSPGCTNCYAMKMAARLEAMGQPIYAGMTQKSKAGAVWTGKVELSNWGQVIKPLSWKKPRRIFVNSMSDLFHESLPDEAIDKVFAVMALTPHHTYQVLTKRAERMRAYMSNPVTPFHRIHEDAAANDVGGDKWRWIRELGPRGMAVTQYNLYLQARWPLPNVWLGVSAERQQEADERIWPLLQTPAAVRFVSAEPLLGPIDLHRATAGLYKPAGTPRVLDWIIVGGESGRNARPTNPYWVRAIRDQCEAAGVSFFFKQWGEWQFEARPGTEVVLPDLEPNQRACWGDGETNHLVATRVGKKSAGRLLDGKEHNAFPGAL